ncbi:MAG: rRNA maturation RNase YbeY [Candidatus Harrisonbacteria bacterium CG10_big_fil_rev_8_21_14_0_10_44_23]|uniref:rRNA maturation RNase YbeY n=1 Tax=Candidatus Harrisonbacteria bacterium CG10_big_fil_rev_8_21_14_0_10_44_23 TaxID=1974585 RepID=A0A2H0URY5_9BACT|nr:MAG: rRNA maturation RNase YbeY [Candidatus Harrisonbacteria bacterium CG10_big_fil_rev_8_21_14_0_10_44_23]
MLSKVSVYSLGEKPHSKKLLAIAENLGQKLIAQLEKGEQACPDKNIHSMNGYFCEVFLVDKEIMDKNVLSFPAPKDFPHPDLEQQPLGEIYLNPEVIQSQGHDLEALLIHGFLHLLGYDHQGKDDTISMQEQEQKLLHAFC